MPLLVKVLIGFALYQLYHLAWPLIFGDTQNKLRDVVFWLLLLCALLTNCQPKPKPETAPTIIYADTTRTILVHRTNVSRESLTIIHARTPQTVADYETSVRKYDSIRVALP